MLYQLPNGRVVYLSIEEYLDLTPEDIQYLVSLNQGETPTDPFFGSITRGKRIRTTDFEEPDDEDDSLDYSPDTEDLDTYGPVDINNIPDDSDPSNF